MFIIIFAVVIGIVMCGVKFKQYLKYKKDIKELTENFTYEVYDYSSGFKIGYCICAIGGIMSAVYGYYQGEDTTIAMGIVITLLFISEILSAEIRYRFYYNESTCIIKDKKVRYKSFKEVSKPNGVPFAFVKIFTINGDRHAISQKCYRLIQEKMPTIKKK